MNKSAAIADDDITVKTYSQDLITNQERLVERLREKEIPGEIGQKTFLFQNRS